MSYSHGSQRSSTGKAILAIGIITIVFCFFLPWFHVSSSEGVPANITGYQFSFDKEITQAALHTDPYLWFAIVLIAILLMLIAWLVVPEIMYFDSLLTFLPPVVLALAGSIITIWIYLQLRGDIAVSLNVKAGLWGSWLGLASIITCSLLDWFGQGMFEPIDDFFSDLFEGTGLHLPCVLGALLLIVIVVLFVPSPVSDVESQDHCSDAVAMAESQMSGMSARWHDYQARADRQNENLKAIMERVVPIVDYIDLLKEQKIGGMSIWDLLTEVLGSILPGEGLGVSVALSTIDNELHEIAALGQALESYGGIDSLVQAIDSFDNQPTCANLWILSAEIVKVRESLSLADQQIEGITGQIKPFQDAVSLALQVLSLAKASSIDAVKESATWLEVNLINLDEPIEMLMIDLEVLSNDVEMDLHNLSTIPDLVQQAAGEALVENSE